MGLKELRKAKGITGSQLAKELGVSERSIRRWDNEGIDNIAFKYVVKLTELFTVEIADLVQCVTSN